MCIISPSNVSFERGAMRVWWERFLSGYNNVRHICWSVLLLQRQFVENPLSVNRWNNVSVVIKHCALAWPGSVELRAPCSAPCVGRAGTGCQHAAVGWQGVLLRLPDFIVLYSLPAWLDWRIKGKNEVFCAVTSLRCEGILWVCWEKY